jgi:hypothetical protein
MRGLKVLVVAMGIMLVVGFAVLVAAVIGKMSRNGSVPTPARTFTSAAIDIPRGARIEAMTTAADRLVLALALPEGDRQLVIIDLGTGARLGTIELHPSP